MDADRYMKRALLLAETARGKTRTNPLVGAVIVRDDQIIGEGYHHFYGGDHAEIDAIKNAGGDVSGATMFVNLEPCSHQGKTPPCAQALIDAGIGKVYAAMVDPNPAVAERGLQMLTDASIEVEVGLCEAEARKLNEAYLKYITTGTPFVILKIAQTLDGKIADFRSYSKWITSEESRKRVHRLRSEVDAVLVGGNSVRLDNPELSCHGVADHDPLRLVLTRSVDFDNKLKVFAGNPQPPTVLITADNAEPSLPVAKWQLTGDSDSRVDLGDLLQKAGKERICSLLVEGGRELFSGFIQAGLVDKYIFVIAPRLLGSGTAAFEEEKVKRSLQESVNIRIDRVEQRGADIWIEGYPE